MQCDQMKVVLQLAYTKRCKLSNSIPAITVSTRCSEQHTCLGDEKQVGCWHVLRPVRACSGEMLLGDNSIKACAIKTLPYGDWIARECAHCELTALQAALGLPNLVQCLGAFKPQSRGGARHLIVATECVLLLPLMPGRQMHRCPTAVQWLRASLPAVLERQICHCTAAIVVWTTLCKHARD